jgi:hypothetical protein
MAVAGELEEGSGHSKRPQRKRRRAKDEVERAPAVRLELTTPGLTDLVAVLRGGLGLDDRQIAEVLDLVADLVEQGEAATASGHSGTAQVRRTA